MSYINDARWMRCSKARPCPICGRADWCCWLSDGAAFFCMRTNVEVAGWKMGSTKESGGTTYFSQPDSPSIQKAPPERKATINKCVIPWDQISAEAESLLSERLLMSLCRSLKLSRESLKKLCVGWNLHYEAFTFPMRSLTTQKIIGIRTRTLCGAKFALTGSHQGYFLPSPTSTFNKEFLYLCEGLTDTAAIAELGLDVIGRASCSHVSKSLIEECANKKVVIIADSDEAGIRGANNLQSKLRMGQSVILIPPKDYKDARLWVTAGLLRKDELTKISRDAFKK